MTLGVVFQGGGTPLRIAAAGQNADGADVFDLLFNGDKEPLRLAGTGYVEVPSLTNYNWSPAWAERSAASIAVPEGTYPIFLVAGKESVPSGSSRLLRTPYHSSIGYGFGAIITSARELWGLNFVHDAGSVRYLNAVINYAILKNHG